MLDPWVLPVLPLVGWSLCELVVRVAGGCGSPSTSPTALDFVLYIPLHGLRSWEQKSWLLGL